MPLTNGDLASTVEARLLRELGGGRVRVDAHRGVVYLRGRVASPTQHEQATRVAHRVPGVADVVNELEIATR
jgi:osmotically-inducible protein OsmY